MSRNAALSSTGQAYVERRRARLADALDRPATVAGADAEPLSAERLEFMRREGEDLYWNELEWEELTDEEAIPGGHLTEMVFPGFLAYIRGLLVETVMEDALAPARPHPDVVEEILAFLGERYAEATTELESGADSQKLVWQRHMTARLIDLVLYRLYRLTPAEQERLETVA
ncbi:hypothetical protein [Longimicrobium sp.]|uniref:hypothetical protein n=1 Tax=Longimicrobium sp. TaxID=2029185 RepID=UPI002E30BDB4|nr:hypothetical protein [Longimicrobium sp.]HEX6037409.1 hypothetical protein [Longimicrobium sp.]